MDYTEAVKRLDSYLQKKTTHGMKDILAFMRELCNEFNWESNTEDQQDFANICSNFDKYVTANGLTYIGRKQFERWWEKQDTTCIDEIELKEDPIDTIFGRPIGDTSVDAAIDKIFGHTQTVDNSRDAHSLKVENTRLRNDNAQLKAELKAANDKLEAIRGIILWG